MTAWNVLCEGPSIRAVRQADLLDGPTVAINDAVRLPLHVDAWAVIDPVEEAPSNVWVRNREHLRLPLELWLPERRVRHWERLGELPKGLTLVPHPRDIHAAKNSWDWLAEMYSTFMAIRECVDRQGATQVRVFGADMKGHGNAVIGYEEAETQADIQRWAKEREWFEMMVRYALERGCAVERWMPAAAEP